MKACTKCNVPQSEELLTNGLCDACENVRPEVLRRLQARIFELEDELKKQRKAAETGGKVLQLMWGYKFNTESLH